MVCIFRVEDDKKLISERFFFFNYDVMKSAMDRELQLLYCCSSKKGLRKSGKSSKALKRFS